MTEAEAPTPSEFLLARIAEDEHRAKYSDPHFDDCEHFMYFPEGGLPCTCGLEDRLLAECAAKRRIVELHGGKDRGFMPLEHGTSKEEALALWKARTPTLTCGVCLFEDAYPCQTLRALALPYVDHPDYSEEWKP